MDICTCLLGQQTDTFVDAVQPVKTTQYQDKDTAKRQIT